MTLTNRRLHAVLLFSFLFLLFSIGSNFTKPFNKQPKKGVESQASYQYKTITVPDNTGAVVLYVNGTLVHRSEYPESTAVYEQRVDYNRATAKIWELAKPQANLTCLSILIKKPRF